MSKVIKVVKRRDVEQAIHNTSGGKAVECEKKVERRSRRELVSTVTNWVSERRERNRNEEMEGLRRIFGDVSSILNGA
ncbi:MAG: hypothetical protein H7Z37_16625 [Pyrinomonadaceae bacterium]|nr:hypothetical protein [Pyrinomonadaceae bacterium]